MVKWFIAQFTNGKYEAESKEKISLKKLERKAKDSKKAHTGKTGQEIHVEKICKNYQVTGANSIRESQCDYLFIYLIR